MTTIASASHNLKMALRIQCIDTESESSWFVLFAGWSKVTCEYRETTGHWRRRHATQDMEVCVQWLAEQNYLT